MFDVYNSKNSEYGNQQLTVPVLFDKSIKRVVSNDPAHILLMLNEAFNEWASNPKLDLYPADKRAQIEEINRMLWPGLNDGVYRCGFAKNEEVYNEAHGALSKSLKWIENTLGQHKFLIADELTLADVRAFPHLLRFDLIYRQLMLRAIEDSPVLSLPASVVGYVEMLFGIPGVRETCDPHLAVVGYWAQLGRAVKGRSMTIAQDDTMYDKFRYAWMPLREELEQKRMSEGLPRNGEQHVTQEHLATL